MPAPPLSASPWAACPARGRAQKRRWVSPSAATSTKLNGFSSIAGSGARAHGSHRGRSCNAFRGGGHGSAGFAAAVTASTWSHFGHPAAVRGDRYGQSSNVSRGRTTTACLDDGAGVHSQSAAVATSGPFGSICALIENRSREVGIASMHRRSLEFELTQFCDSGSYARTCAAVLALEPAVVVMSRTARGTQLHQTLEDTLSAAGMSEPMIFVERRHFDETEGQAILEKADVIGLAFTDFSAKFVACAAFAALWCFAESSMESRLQASAARVVYRGAADTMVIDASTARLLELVVSTHDQREKGSVFGLFCCRTPGGGRLLRQSLLQPPAALGEIESRQTAVEMLLGDEALFYELQRLLPTLGDIDLLAARLTAEPRTRGQQWCKAAVRTAIRLRHALAALPLLTDALEESASKGSSSLLSEARATLGHAKFPGLLKSLDKVLDSDSPPQHQSGSGGSMAHAALLYSVRPGVNALLDVARQTWSDALERIHALHQGYAVKFPDLGLRLEFSDRRGWYLSHTSQVAVPEEFLQTQQKGTSSRNLSTTRELNTENFKLRQAEREVLAQTLGVLEGLFATLREEAALLYHASHAASVLDLIQALTGYTLLLGESVRPQLTDDAIAPVAIKAGRHPLKERLGRGVNAMSGDSFEPLDFFIGSACNFQVVTGPNGAGKSTYLQTLAQLVVLAQIGCFVPAKYAKMRVMTSLLTRIGASDCLEASASTFLVEMQEAAHIVSAMAQRSLVLIDELGRGTAHADGLALCWAVCERLLELGVYTLFATHFYEICKLQDRYSGVRNMHLEATEEDGRLRLMVRHVTSLQELHARVNTHYGLRAAAQAGLPDSLVASARRMAEFAEARMQPSHQKGAADVAAEGPGPGLDLVAKSAKVQAASALAANEAATEPDEAAARKVAQQLLGLAGSSLTAATLADMVRKLRRPWLRRAESNAATAHE